MARHPTMTISPKAFQTLPQGRGMGLVKEFDRESPFCFRYCLEDEKLRASIRKFGILVPVVVARAKRPVVVAGHRRLAAARALKMKEVPVRILEKIEPREAFFLNLVSNWNQGFSEMDRVQALRMAARGFHFNENEILSVVMPLLGLPEDKAALELYRQADSLSPFFKDFVEQRRLSLRGVLPFLKFPKSDQDYFAREIVTKVKLTSSQLSQTGEWLRDILKRTGQGLSEICKAQGLLAKMNTRGMDPRMKADLFFARVRKLRFPGHSLYLETFEKRRADILRDAKEFRLEPVQGFEEPGFELCARVRNPAELERLFQKISLKHSLLNSLFEIAL
ncbi:MAG: ParB/RepB/Spo0J family partition protein [Candidatus Omnitrophota bacterium]